MVHKQISSLRQWKLFIVRVSLLSLLLAFVIFCYTKPQINEYMSNLVVKMKVTAARHIGMKKEIVLKREDGEDDINDNCQGFHNDPLHPSITMFFKKTPPITCKGGYPNLVYADKKKNRLVFNKTKAESLGKSVDYCQYVSLTRRPGNGFDVDTSDWSKNFTDWIKIPENVDHFLCQCFKGDQMVGYGYLSIIRVNPAKEKIYQDRLRKYVSQKKPKEILNIMMMAIDGTSKHNFERQMPKTRDFLKNDMGAIEMLKLNKVGLNTFPNVVPLLTGYSTKEVRKQWNDKTYIDKIDHLFLWSDAQKIGYRTSLIFDNVATTAFHFQKKGWKNPKFDYYYRPVVIKSRKDKIARKVSQHCIGDRTEIDVIYDYWLDLVTTFNNSRTQPYFAYSFFTQVTHHMLNTASSIDNIHADLFNTFVNMKFLNDTLLIFFSDHGTRFGSFRSTFRGTLEDSNPFMFFVFPPWFKEKYPKIMANFRNNTNRMMTNFDVHATLKDMLNFHGDEMIRKGTKKTKGISLFQELPKSRTCDEAGIPLQYCNCQPKENMKVSRNITESLSKAFLTHVISKTNALRKKCVLLSLNTTVSVMTMTLQTSTKLYQATIKTMPGGAIYEASLRKTKKGKQEYEVTGDVARLNMYKGQAECIEDARIRPFCYCLHLPDPAG